MNGLPTICVAIDRLVRSLTGAFMFWVDEVGSGATTFPPELAIMAHSFRRPEDFR